MKRGAALVALVLTTAACGSASHGSLSLPQVPLAKRSVVCGAPKPWTSNGRLAHAQRLGHLVWIDVPSYKAGRPTKVTIEAVASARNARIRLFGTRCADGTPLRFGFFSDGGGSVMPERLAAKSGLASGGAGYLPLALGRMHGHGWRDSGYVTFTRGKWIVQARSGWTRTLGSVVFEVR